MYVMVHHTLSEPCFGMRPTNSLSPLALHHTFPAPAGRGQSLGHLVELVSGVRDSSHRSSGPWV
jgi:hypothetical protein